MTEKSTISFGDNVRVSRSAITEKLGLVGKIGNVQGETSPSITGVEVVGEIKDDYAINVFFEDLNKSWWFARNLLEFVDHSPGSEITVTGISKKWTRSQSGQWVEGNLNKKPWWKFW